MIASPPERALVRKEREKLQRKLIVKGDGNGLPSKSC